MTTPPRAVAHPVATSAPPATTRRGRVLRFPLTWLVIGGVAIALTDDLFLGSAISVGVPGAVVLPLLGAGAMVGIYLLVMRFLARRPVPELTLRGALRETAYGVLLGLAFLLTAALGITALGGYSFSVAPGSGVGVVLIGITISLGAAAGEELLFRGLALQAVEQLAGSRAALVVTAVLFGGAHLLNPKATLWSAIAIALEAGVLLGAAFLWRRNLWFVIGLHAAWNTAEGWLGIPVSGHRGPSLLIATVHGPALLTGGDFGLEASVLPVLISIALAVPMLMGARRSGGLRSRRGGPVAAHDRAVGHRRL